MFKLRTAVIYRSFTVLLPAIYRYLPFKRASTESKKKKITSIVIKLQLTVSVARKEL